MSPDREAYSYAGAGFVVPDVVRDASPWQGVIIRGTASVLAGRMVGMVVASRPSKIRFGWFPAVAPRANMRKGEWDRGIDGR